MISLTDWYFPTVIQDQPFAADDNQGIWNPRRACKVGKILRMYQQNPWQVRRSQRGASALRASPHLIDKRAQGAYADSEVPGSAWKSFLEWPRDLSHWYLSAAAHSTVIDFEAKAVTRLRSNVFALGAHPGILHGVETGVSGGVKQRFGNHGLGVECQYRQQATAAFVRSTCGGLTNISI